MQCSMIRGIPTARLKVIIAYSARSPNYPNIQHYGGRGEGSSSRSPEEVVYVHANGMMHPTTPPSAWIYPKPDNEADKGKESIATNAMKSKWEAHGFSDPEEDFHAA